MMNRILFSTLPLHVGVSWLGLGRLYAIDRERNLIRFATGRQKAFVFAVLRSAEDAGLNLRRESEKRQTLLKYLALEILNAAPDGWAWQANLTEGPAAFAQRALLAVDDAD